MHTNNMGGHGPTNREIDAKVLALRAAIAEDQIRRQQSKVSNNNHTMNNPQYHTGLIPSHSFNQRMDMLQQQQQQQTTATSTSTTLLHWTNCIPTPFKRTKPLPSTHE